MEINQHRFSSANFQTSCVVFLAAVATNVVLALVGIVAIRFSVY